MIVNVLRNVRTLGGVRRIAFRKNIVDIVKKYPTYSVTNHIPKWACLAFVSFVYIAKAESSDQDMDSLEKEDQIARIIEQSDELFLRGKFEESLKILQPIKGLNEAEVFWRMSRALYNMSKGKGISNSQKAEYIEEAYEFITLALIRDDKNSSVHKWMAILIDAKSALLGIKSRITTLPLFKKHLMKAIELNPSDATAIYMLGHYSYNLADMSWMEISIAKTFFATPPQATFEEALSYFIKAEDLEPNFYSANLLMLGKTYLKLKRMEPALYWLNRAINYPVRTHEDGTVRREAEELLKKLPGFKDKQ